LIRVSRDVWTPAFAGVTNRLRLEALRPLLQCRRFARRVSGPPCGRRGDTKEGSHMAQDTRPADSAPFFYLVTFEIAPEDEAAFNEIYDTEHIPNILQVDGVLQVIRFRDAEPTAAGWLQYSALYLITRADLPTTPEWRAKSDIGRWAPVIRPRVKSRHQRLGRMVANSVKPA
jgi:hypothetical protein